MPGPANYLVIGSYEFGDGVPARCVVTVKPKSSLKLDKKEADGKNDAVITNKGRKVAEWDVEIEWNVNDLAADAAVEENLYQLSPRGPNSGKSWQFASRRARVHGTTEVEVEELDGPNDTPGTGKSSAKMKLCSWAKPAATTSGQGNATTPTDADKGGGAPFHVDADGKVVPGPATGGTVHVDANGKVQPGPAPALPAVKP